MVYRCEILRKEVKQWYRNGVPIKTIPTLSWIPPGDYYVQHVEQDDIVYVNRIIFQKELDREPIEEYIEIMPHEEVMKRLKRKPKLFFYKLLKTQ